MTKQESINSTTSNHVYEEINYDDIYREMQMLIMKIFTGDKYQQLYSFFLFPFK